MSTIFQVGPEGDATALSQAEEHGAILDLTPSEIVQELDKFIIGQEKAKRAVAIALRNRRRRQKLAEDIRDEVIPKNILMIGPTGVGKTEIARRLANLAHAPFIKVEATKFTEVGYVGRDVDSMVRDLVQVAHRLVEDEEVAKVREKAREAAVERVLDLLQPGADSTRPVDKIAAALGGYFSRQQGRSEEEQPAEGFDFESEESEEELSDYDRKKAQMAERVRAKLRAQLLAGELEERTVEIEVEDNSSPFLQVFSPQGMEEMGMDLSGMLGGMMPRRKRTRRVTVAEAREVLADQVAREMVDHDKIVRDAIERAEQAGIIFVDEVDKIAGRERGEGSGPSVSREGVQRDILPIIEGSTVMTKQGPVRTHHILFIAAGAFHVSKPSDLIPELQGRLPIRVELESLSTEDFKRILTEPKNALVKQYTALLETEAVTVEFKEEAIAAIAEIAADVNSRTENIGARRLHTIMERLLEDISFDAPNLAGQTVTIDESYVKQRLADLAKDEDLARYIL
ncbi:MAG: ATP-dependent protease ATPase subunit HslU [Armatimonadetes bacterium]|nr:ATP-dependent protease ATPase subunit HslU [Armatimonadota bacterium]